MKGLLALVLLVVTVSFAPVARADVGPSCPAGAIPVGRHANLHKKIEDGTAHDYCLAAATYRLSTSLLPNDGDRIYGQPATRNADGSITAPTKIASTAADGVIRASYVGMSLTVVNLDICCSPDTNPGHLTGRGLNGYMAFGTNLTVRYCRIHGNGQQGIGGWGPGLNVDRSEIDHNGNGTPGYDAGIKTINYAVVTNTYFHDGGWNGMWWDCDAPGGRFEGNTVTRFARSGVFVEISSGDSGAWGDPPPAGESYGFLVRDNTVTSNNVGQGANGHAGLLIENSRNVTFDSNVVTDNGNWNINVTTDSRVNQGHGHCDSGFPLQNDTVSNNVYGPLGIQGCDTVGVTCTNNTKI